MKNFFFALLLVLISICVNGQQLEYVKQYQTIGTQQDDDIYRVFFNKKIPSIPIEDINGNYSTLDTYIRKNRKFTDKPILLITSYSFCAGCITMAKKIYEEGLSGKYNLIILYEAFNKKTEISLKEFIQKYNLDREFPNFLVVKSNKKISHKFLSVSGTPLYLVCDSDLKPVYSSLGYESEDVPGIMNLLDKKLISREKISYNKAGKVVSNNDRTAYHSLEIAENENSLQFIKLIDNKVEVRLNYLLKDGKFFKDGLTVENHILYAKDSSLILKERKRVSYKEGKPTEDFISYYQNGKKERVWPMNGTLQAFDEVGKLIIEGKTKNGLGEGVFNYYTDNKISGVVTYTNGIKNGPFKTYEKGNLKITGFYKDDEKDGLELEYNDSGSVNYETYRSNKYDDIGEFSEGLAFVKLDGKYGYINKTGSEVITLIYDEAESFKYGKAKVTLDGKEIYIDIMGRIKTDTKPTDYTPYFESLLEENKILDNIIPKWRYIYAKGETMSGQKRQQTLNFPEKEIQKDWLEGKYVTDLSFGGPENNKNWVLINSKNKFTDQLWRTAENAADLEKTIIDIHNKNPDFYISHITYGDGKWVVIFSKGTGYSGQTTLISSTFPEEDIASAGKKSFTITDMAYGGGKWIVCMSKNPKNFGQEYTTSSFWDDEKTKENAAKGYFLTEAVKQGDKWWFVFSKEKNIIEQIIEQSDKITSEELQKRWKEGYDIYRTYYH